MDIKQLFKDQPVPCMHFTFRAGGGLLDFFLPVERMRMLFDIMWATADRGRLNFVGRKQHADWLEPQLCRWRSIHRKPQGSLIPRGLLSCQASRRHWMVIISLTKLLTFPLTNTVYTTPLGTTAHSVRDYFCFSSQEACTHDLERNNEIRVNGKRHRSDLITCRI